MNPLDKRDKFSLLYSFIIFSLLLVVAFPSLSFPPISDYWSTMFYPFHHFNELSGPFKWLHVLNIDPCEQMRFQPLSRVFYYILHLVFGSNFMFFNIVNFILYFLSILLLYKFSLYFVKNKILAAVFIGFFAFLFSHFDILLWSCHLYIIAGLIMFLLGFMCYVRFLRISGSYLPFLIILCFLFGMWCYEAFFFWPLAILILSRIRSLKRGVTVSRKKVARVNWLVLSMVYGFYFLFYLFTRSLGTYEGSLHTIFDFLKWKVFTSSGFLVFFNVLYNNIVVNILPILAFPLKVTENIYMRGPVINYLDEFYGGIIFIGGALVVITLFWFFFVLYRKKYFDEIKIIGLFLFLMLSELYVVFFGKLGILHPLAYCLTEFRYQYIPNAFLFLIIIYLINRFLKPSKIKQRIIYLVLIPLFALNIYCSQRVIGVYNSHLVNLKKMFYSIRFGINKGSINEDNKIYIDSDMPDYLPSLCWNIYMGERFINEGNYQWMFSKKEVKYFSKDIDGAVWIIDKDKFNVVEKTAENIRKKGKKVNLGKAEQYKELGSFYMNENNHGKAERMFKKAETMAQ